MTDPEILPEDFRAALKEMHGYLDITEGDLLKIYRLALDHAHRRLTEDVLVQEVMHREVVSVTSGVHPHEAEALLFRHRIGGMPVVDGEHRVVGVISETDFLYRLEDPELFTFMDRLKHYLLRKEHHGKTHGDTVAELMTAPAITVQAGETVRRAATLMVERAVNRLPVVDGAGHLVGIVTRADLVRLLHRQKEQGEEGEA
jgi:CBS domain-containing membrane protein